MVQIVYNYEVEPQLKKNLDDRLIRRAVNRGVGKAATKIARQWRKDCKAACPVRTGALRRSLITVRTRLRSDGISLHRYEIEVGPRGILKGTSRNQFYFYILISPWYERRYRRRSFVKAAFEKRRTMYQKIILDEIWLSLREAWKGKTAVAFPLPAPRITSEVGS